MKAKQKETFDVRLLCRNCNNDWVEEIDKGIYVRSEKDNNYMIKVDDPKKKHILFTCPKCGANKKIARRPLL